MATTITGRRSTSLPARLLDCSNRESSRCCNAMKCVAGAGRDPNVTMNGMYSYVWDFGGVSLPLDGERNLVGTESMGAMEVIMVTVSFFFPLLFSAWFSSHRLLLHLDRVWVPVCCDVLCCVYSRIQTSVNKGYSIKIAIMGDHSSTCPLKVGSQTSGLRH